MNKPRGKILLALLTFSLLGAKCTKEKAETKMVLINLTSAYSMSERVSIPVERLAKWLSLTQEIRTGLEIIEDHKLTADEREEIYQRLGSGVNHSTFNIDRLVIAGHRINIVIEKLGFEKLYLGGEFYTSAVEEILRGNIVGGLAGKSRKVTDLDDHPGRSMNVFEPTLRFDDLLGGYIFADVRVRARFQINGHRLGASNDPRMFYLPLHGKLRVIIREASIPVDVFYDDEITGVKINPERRRDELSIGYCTVEIDKVEFVKLPKFLKHLSGTIIGGLVSDQLSVEIQKAIPSYYFLSSDDDIQAEVARLSALVALDVGGRARR